ncbi:MAG: methyltransferase domain-containing protein [Saprospiraceae bacterium]|nr:methyltransferase domain-containing protein [Saprospiraceae bacterium]
MTKLQTTRSMTFLQDSSDEHQLVPGHYYLFNWIKPFVRPDSKILDIGCWTGPLEILFSKIPCHVTGIDIEEAPLTYAREHFPKYRFIKASIVETLPFDRHEFDIVTYFMVIEHVPPGTELNSLININKSLKLGGQLFMNTMNSTIISNLIDPAYLLGHRHYSKKHLEILLNLAGFEIQEVRYNAGYFTTLHILLLYFFKHVLRRKEPRNSFLDKLMWMDYQNRGFAEIDIQAVKISEV